VAVDLRTMRVLGRPAVGDSPDVVAWDAPAWRLYVASEAGMRSAFRLDGTTLRPMGEVRAPHAHTVAADPKTHRVFLPLQDVDGRTVLRIYAPAK
jgi:hypothetical protein